MIDGRGSPAGDTEQMATGRKVVRNTAVLSVGQAVTLVTMTLWTMIVARYIGPETYGIYGYAQATLAVLIIFVNLGLDKLLTREVAQRPEDGAQYLVTFLAIKLALATVVLGGFLAVISWRGWSGERAAITLVATAIYFVLTLIALANAFLYAHQAMHYSVLGQSLNPILTLASGALAVWLKQPFAMVLWLSLGASVVQLALALYFCRRFCRRPEAGLRSLVMPGRVVAGMLKTAVSFTALALIAVLNGNVVTLLVRLLTADDRGVGYFAAAQRIQAMAFMIPDMLLLAIFPAFARTYSTAPERFAAMFERAYRYIFLVTVPMAVGLWVVAPEVLDLIYGREFAPAAHTLQILALVLATSVGYVMGPAMLAMDRQTMSALISGGAVVSVALAGVWAIPRYGAEGAAWAVVASMLISRAVYSLVLFRWLRLRYPRSWMLKTVLASLAMGWVAGHLVRQVHFLIVAFVLAPAVYGLLHLVLRTLSAGDWAYVKQLLPGRAQRLLVAVIPQPRTAENA